MRVLRVTPPSQIALDLPSSMLGSASGSVAAAQRWWQLPEASRVQVLALLSRLIARGVLVEGDQAVVSQEEGRG